MICTSTHVVDGVELLGGAGRSWRLRCRGWFHARATYDPVPHDRLRFSLAIPGADPFPFGSGDAGLPSEDVAGYLGADASRARFDFTSPPFAPELHVDQAAFRATFENGDVILIDAGRLIARPEDG